jgi:hypothetical protein
MVSSTFFPLEYGNFRLFFPQKLLCIDHSPCFFGCPMVKIWQKDKKRKEKLALEVRGG